MQTLTRIPNIQISPDNFYNFCILPLVVAAAVAVVKDSSAPPSTWRMREGCLHWSWSITELSILELKLLRWWLEWNRRRAESVKWKNLSFTFIVRKFVAKTVQSQDKKLKWNFFIFQFTVSQKTLERWETEETYKIKETESCKIKDLGCRFRIFLYQIFILFRIGTSESKF